MSASLHALLGNMIDYAGLFPPANLTLDRAIRNYARHRQGAEKWMLGRFVIAAAKLSELSAFEKHFETSSSLPLAVLGRGGNTPDELVQGVTDDLRDLAEFHQRFADRVQTDVFEIKLPDAMVYPQNHQALCYTLVRAADLFESFSPTPLKPYYEMGLGGDWRGSVRSLLGAFDYITSYGKTRFQGKYRRCQPAGFKLRCGGKTAAAIPTPQQMGFIITTCREREVMLKATAGLHHPFRRFDDTLRTQTHGFLNLLAGAVLGFLHRFNEDQVRRLIEDEDYNNFTFDDYGCRWRDFFAPLADIEGTRKQLVAGFGSCSFDEPREDLRALKLL